MPVSPSSSTERSVGAARSSVWNTLSIAGLAAYAALVGDEATCKRFFPEKDHIRLQPENRTMAPILVPKNDWRGTQLLGVVVGVYRKL